MPSGAPWSVKGIDPRARAIAKTAARREGMTLGDWLNRVILDDGPQAGAADWEERLSGYPGFGGGGGDGDDDDALRAVIRRLTDRLEASEQRSTLALTGVDQSVLALSRRLKRWKRPATKTRARLKRRWRAPARAMTNCSSACAVWSGPGRVAGRTRRR